MIYHRESFHPLPPYGSGRGDWSGPTLTAPALLSHGGKGCDRPDNCPPESLAADIHEDTGHYHVCLEVPGIKREDLTVELEGRTLSVCGQRFWKRGEGEASQSFRRILAIPASVITEDITAHLEDGILTVSLPKSEQIKPRIIPLS